jgi:2-succinyl-6-hydroxy-2,4-cyclohexadiene-1-carboxylate synthase
MLSVTTRGTGPRVVLVHGFTQTGACWGPLADDLARDHELVLVDAPGHGGSADVRVPFAAGAALVGDAGGRAVYLGYSMGGRYALRLALDRPERVARLVLVGASPGLADPDERAARRVADDALAARVEAIGVPAFLDEWLALPLFAGLGPGVRFMTQRLANTAAGLASSLRLAGTGAQEPLWDRLGELSMPVLLMVGERDAKFRAVAEAMAARIGPAAQLVVVASAGHTAHLENPDAVIAAIRSWRPQADRKSPPASSTPNTS